MTTDKKKRSLLYRFIRWNLIWVVLPLVIVYTALWIWHPEDTLLQHQLQKLEEDTGIRIAYDEISVTPTFGLLFKNFIVEQLEQRLERPSGLVTTIPSRRFFTADRFMFRVAFRPLLHGQAGIFIGGNAYNGTFTTQLIMSILNTKDPVRLMPKWQGIDLEALRRDYPDMQQIKGIAQGHAQLDWYPENAGSAKGPVHLMITDVAYTLPEQVSGALDLQFISKVVADFTLNGPSITVEKVWLYGDTGSIFISGTIYRDYNPENSILDLSARIHSHALGELPNEEEYIPVTIKGTAGDPRIEFMGISLERILHSGAIF